MTPVDASNNPQHYLMFNGTIHHQQGLLSGISVNNYQTQFPAATMALSSSQNVSANMDSTIPVEPPTGAESDDEDMPETTESTDESDDDDSGRKYVLFE